ncbi:MAG TPA: hypothetical protein V6D14_11750 [Coleofasciculaceae cyanobacterium]|jgi:hypothetical protein
MNNRAVSPSYFATAIAALLSLGLTPKKQQLEMSLKHFQLLDGLMRPKTTN